MAGAQGAPRLEESRAAYLERLHDGRFATTEGFVVPGESKSENLFFQAFTTYWKLVFDDDNDELQVLLDEQLDAAVDAAAREKGQPLASLWGGNSHLLIAQLRAWQRRPLSAAFEAKKAKKTLEAAIKLGVDGADAFFGLGTYNYVADAVPSYVKGLRALLFLPPGNRTKGLEQLEHAASASRYFAFEARVLLITIYANRHERLYDLAMDERDKLLLQAPDSVSSLYASARLDLSLGRNKSAIDALERARARAVRLGDVDPVVLRWIDLLRARGQFADLRPDLAAATAQAALATGRGLSPSIREDFEKILAASGPLASGIDWSGMNASRPLSDEAARLGRLAGERLDHPLLALMAGDACLRAGQAQEAIRWLERASQTELPSALLAGCQLRQGQAADLLGERTRALDFYKRAAEAPGFLAKDAAIYYQRTPYRSGA